MTLKAVNNGGRVERSTNDLKADRKYNKGQEALGSSGSARKSDSLELSEEALKLQAVRTKIDQNFYDSPEAIKKTVERLYNDIKDSDF